MFYTFSFKEKSSVGLSSSKSGLLCGKMENKATGHFRELTDSCAERDLMGIKFRIQVWNQEGFLIPRAQFHQQGTQLSAHSKCSPIFHLYGYYKLNCASSTSSYVKVLTPILQKVPLFGDIAFKSN